MKGSLRHGFLLLCVFLLIFEQEYISIILHVMFSEICARTHIQVYIKCLISHGEEDSDCAPLDYHIV
jgi:hypothetical protein